MVFHGTTFEAMDGILQASCIRPAEGKTYVSLTELPIDNLDRLRTLGPRVSEVAIGFPRALLESRGLYQPAYLKHSSPEVKTAMQNLPPGYVELEDDLGALHEVRIPGSLDIMDALWLLSSVRNEETGALDHPMLQMCQQIFGMALSYWHSTHQREMIQEHVYRQSTRDAEGGLDSIICRGAYYALKDSPRIEKKVKLPAGITPLLRFPTLPHSNGWEGPFTKFEMASFFYQEMKRSYPDLVSLIQGRINMD
jgi:hypothetical protein